MLFRPWISAGVLCCAALAFTASSVHAQVVYNNGSPDNVRAYYSDPGSIQLAADTFSFASTTSFNTVTWFGIYSSVAAKLPDNFTLSFYDTTVNIVDGPTPNSTARTGQTYVIGNSAVRTNTGEIFNDGFNTYTVYQYSFVLPTSVTFAAGTYGIGIVNTTNAGLSQGWAWSTSNQTGQCFVYDPTGGVYSGGYPGDLAFNLSNTAVTAAAPEPGSIALLGMGFAGMAGTMIRKRRNSRKA